MKWRVKLEVKWGKRGIVYCIYSNFFLKKNNKTLKTKNKKKVDSTFVW